MSALDFLDTNILVYAYDPADKRKQRIAQDLLRAALTGAALTSTQVWAEFAATLLHKASPPVTSEAVKPVLDTLSPIQVITPDAGVVRRGVEARREYGIHFLRWNDRGRRRAAAAAGFGRGPERRPALFRRNCGESIRLSAAAADG
jgi:predicted nucleic acid-binding protein